MTLLRRWLVLAALFFWQGGFTFYAAVVVPIGQDELHSHRAQGFITRRVTNSLNLAGGIALVPLAWDLAIAPRRRSLSHWLRWGLWLGMVAALIVLFCLHPHLEGLMDLENHEILDRASFRYGHRWYLWISTFQWLFALVYMWLSIIEWRRQDRRLGESVGPESGREETQNTQNVSL